MRPSRLRPWFSLLPGVLSGLAFIAMFVGIAACAPLSAPDHPPASALATATAAASATTQAGSSAQASQTPMNLPSNLGDMVDPGWAAVVQVPDGLKLGGPSVSGQPNGGDVASSTMTLGYFKLSSAAQVAIVFGCTSPATTIATLEVGVEGSSSKVTCTPAGATMNRVQMTFAASDVGRRLTVTATISTDGATPKWYALIEQPK